MGDVWGCDSDEFDTVAALAFGLKHLLPMAVGTIGIEAETNAVVARAIGIDVHGAGDKGELAVKDRARTMGEADLTSFAATDKAPASLFHVPRSNALSMCDLRTTDAASFVNQ